MLKLLRAALPALDNFLNSNFGLFADLVMYVLDIAIIYILVRVFSVLLRRLVVRSYKKRMVRSDNPSKEATIGKLTEHGTVVFVWYVGVVAVLCELELATTVMSMLATAGIGGIAIGLGAQSLIKDMINGGFLLVEQQIAVGDYVRMADVDGTVEDINMRTTRLRAFSGELHIIPNSAVTVVTNYSRGTNRALVDVPVPYKEDPLKVADMLQKAMDAYFEAHGENLSEAPKVIGITQYGDSAMMLRIVAHCRNLTHWETERNIRNEVLRIYNENNISVPHGMYVVTAHGGEVK